MQQGYLGTHSRALWLGIVIILLLAGCARQQPNNIENVCSIFRQYPDWYWATQKTYKRWKVPPHVQMAIIHQESSFKHKIRPARTKLLWIIPWKRPSTSLGYSQALSTTWREYQKAGGGKFANRRNFADAIDFIGWYANNAHRRAAIARDDAYALYLAYHEGVGGYQRGTYRKKKSLLNVARKVQNRSERYKAQLAACAKKLPRKPWYRLW